MDPINVLVSLLVLDTHSFPWSVDGMDAFLKVLALNAVVSLFKAASASVSWPPLQVERVREEVTIHSLTEDIVHKIVDCVLRTEGKKCGLFACKSLYMQTLRRRPSIVLHGRPSAAAFMLHAVAGEHVKAYHVFNNLASREQTWPDPIILRNVLPHFTRLEELRLSNVDVVKLMWPASMPVRRLYVNDCVGLDGDTGPPMGSMPRLEEVQIMGPFRGLSGFLRQCPALKSATIQSLQENGTEMLDLATSDSLENAHFIAACFRGSRSSERVAGRNLRTLEICHREKAMGLEDASIIASFLKDGDVREFTLGGGLLDPEVAEHFASEAPRGVPSVECLQLHLERFDLLPSFPRARSLTLKVVRPSALHSLDWHEWPARLHAAISKCDRLTRIDVVVFIVDGNEVWFVLDIVSELREERVKPHVRVDGGTNTLKELFDYQSLVSRLKTKYDANQEQIAWRRYLDDVAQNAASLTVSADLFAEFPDVVPPGTILT